MKLICLYITRFLLSHKFYLSGFFDENGTMNTALSQNLWENNFSPKKDKVQVDIVPGFDTPADLEKIIAMGFRVGFIMGLQHLDRLLLTLKK